MSIFNEYNLSPGVLASLTEPTPDLQRNYRTRGMIDGFGELQKNGRYKYSLSDLVAFWICDRLAAGGRGMDRRDGFHLGYMLAGNVINHFLHMRHGIQPMGFRFAVTLSEGAGDKDEAYGQSVMTCSSLGEIEGKTFDHAQIVDIHNLTRNIPEQIKALLIVADENEIDEAGAHLFHG